MKGENKQSEKGMARGHAKDTTVRSEEHVGEKGRQGGVTFRLPADHEMSNCSKPQTSGK